jgi:hypothetical protein
MAPVGAPNIASKPKATQARKQAADRRRAEVNRQEEKGWTGGFMRARYLLFIVALSADAKKPAEAG